MRGLSSSTRWQAPLRYVKAGGALRAESSKLKKTLSETGEAWRREISRSKVLREETERWKKEAALANHAQGKGRNRGTGKRKKRER